MHTIKCEEKRKKKWCASSCKRCHQREHETGDKRIYRNHVYHRIVSIKGVSLHITCQYGVPKSQCSGFGPRACRCGENVCCNTFSEFKSTLLVLLFPFEFEFGVGIGYFMLNQIMRCVRQ